MPLVAILLLLMASPAISVAVELPGPLVEPEWLAQHHDDVTVLDVRMEPESFTRPSSGGHTPDAIPIIRPVERMTLNLQ